MQDFYLKKYILILLYNPWTNLLHIAIHEQCCSLIYHAIENVLWATQHMGQQRFLRLSVVQSAVTECTRKSLTFNIVFTELYYISRKHCFSAGNWWMGAIWHSQSPQGKARIIRNANVTPPLITNTECNLSPGLEDQTPLTELWKRLINATSKLNEIW